MAQQEVHSIDRDLGLILWLPATGALLLIFSLLQKNTRQEWFIWVVGLVLLTCMVLSCSLMFRYKRFRARGIIQYMIVFCMLYLFSQILVNLGSRFSNEALSISGDVFRLGALVTLVVACALALHLSKRNGFSVPTNPTLLIRIAWVTVAISIMLLVHTNPGGRSAPVLALNLASVLVSWGSVHVAIGLLFLYLEEDLSSYWAWYGLGVFGMGFSMILDIAGRFTMSESLCTLSQMIMLAAVSAFGFGVILMARSVKSYFEGWSDYEVHMKKRLGVSTKQSLFWFGGISGLLVLQELLEEFVSSHAASEDLMTTVVVAAAISMIVTVLGISISSRREIVTDHAHELEIYEEALEAVTLDGRVTPREKDLLLVLRKALHISMTEHDRLVLELAGIELEE